MGKGVRWIWEKEEENGERIGMWGIGERWSRWGRGGVISRMTEFSPWGE